jgi:hypothetical protein
MNGGDFAVHLLAHCPRCHLLLFSGRPDSAEIVERADLTTTGRRRGLPI